MKSVVGKSGQATGAGLRLCSHSAVCSIASSMKTLALGHRQPTNGLFRVSFILSVS